MHPEHTSNPSEQPSQGPVERQPELRGQTPQLSPPSAREISSSLIDIHLEAARSFAERHALDLDVLTRTLNCTDLTSLNTTDTSAKIHDMAKRAAYLESFNADLKVASLCVYPRFAAEVVDQLSGSSIQVAVVNSSFPHGQAPIEEKVFDIRNLVGTGVDKIDVLFPTALFLEGRTEECFDQIRQMREACGEGVKLQIIMETGAFPGEGTERLQSIADAANMILYAGGHPKTSTGKEGFGGATPEVVATMLLVTADFEEQTGATVLVKPSGGIRTPEDAALYQGLVRSIRGEDAVTPDQLRFGASGLVDNVLKALAEQGVEFPAEIEPAIREGKYLKVPSGY
jgi:deoxyribose-phosphate aldolase